jgi:hypothetical protein
MRYPVRSNPEAPVDRRSLQDIYNDQLQMVETTYLVSNGWQYEVTAGDHNGKNRTHGWYHEKHAAGEEPRTMEQAIALTQAWESLEPPHPPPIIKSGPNAKIEQALRHAMATLRDIGSLPSSASLQSAIDKANAAVRMIATLVDSKPGLRRGTSNPFAKTDYPDEPEDDSEER